MGVQNSINAMLGTAAGAAVAGKHLTNQKELNKSFEEIKENIRPQAEIEKEMKDYNLGYASGKYTTDPKLGEELKQSNKIEMEKINEGLNRFNTIDKMSSDIDWDSVNAEADAISASLQAEKEPKMAEKAIESMSITTQNKIERMDSVNQLHETLKQGGTVKPYAIIKGTGRAKKKYLD